MKKNSLCLYRWQYILLISSLIFVGGACARKVAFTPSTVVPAARSSIKIKRDNNSNYAIRISISNLAPAKELIPSRRTYVVWIETDKGIKNIGQLKSGSGLFSKALKASLETVTSFKPSRIFITAEDDPALLHPGMQVVLTTRSF